MCVLNFVFVLVTLSDVFGETVYFVPGRGYKSVRPDPTLERRNFERRTYLDYGSLNEDFGKGRDEFKYDRTPSSNKEYFARGSEVYGRNQAKNEDYYRRSDTYPNFKLSENFKNFDSQEIFAPNRRESVRNLSARFGHDGELDPDTIIPTHNPIAINKNQIARHSDNTQHTTNSPNRDHNRQTNYQNMNNNEDRYHSNKQNEPETIVNRQKNNHNEQISANTHNNNKKIYISRVVPEPNIKGFNNTKSLGRNDAMDEVNWAWGTDPESETTPDPFDDRVALSGDKCPTGMIRVGGKCVQPV